MTSPIAAGEPRLIEGIAAPPADDRAGQSTDHPGRWLGGAIGALVSLAAAVVAGWIEGRPMLLDRESWSVVGLLGIPIGFALGRQFFPLARSEGWRRAIAVGLLLGWLAPPLGAVEILGASDLLITGPGSSLFGGPVALLLLPIAIPISFIAVVITLPVGLAWGVLARLVPDEVLPRLRVPGWLAWLGIRHALVLIAVEVMFLAVIRSGSS
jgi:hypothetical protein